MKKITLVTKAPGDTFVFFKSSETTRLIIESNLIVLLLNLTQINLQIKRQ